MISQHGKTMMERYTVARSVSGKDSNMSTMEAPVPVYNEEEVAAVMETTGTGINKTNIDYAVHHIAQAQKSLDRAMGKLNAMTNGKSGTFATKLIEGRDRLYLAEDAFSDSLGAIDGVVADLRELYG